MKTFIFAEKIQVTRLAISSFFNYTLCATKRFLENLKIE